MRHSSLRSAVAGLLLTALACEPAGAVEPAPALAISDADVLQRLDRGGLSLAAMLGAPNLSTRPAFALPALEGVRSVIADAAARARRDDGAQVFDPQTLLSENTRFVLAGVVNRMDRAYIPPDTCGEVRLIYRLTRDENDGAPPRLPMTINLVVRAANAVPCTAAAAAWLADPAAAAARLRADALDRIEVNLLLAHHPRSEAEASRADYLLAVFRREGADGAFKPAPMENEIDRARLAADAALRRDFEAWLLTPQNLVALDRGTLLIPERFLAREAIATVPSSHRAEPLIGDETAVAALARLAASGGTLEHLRSPKAFAVRLKDVTCSGCHETRGIGGFHFPGTDWSSAPSTLPASSPQFRADQSRRRDIVQTLAAGGAPDFSRGFSARPQQRGEAMADDGWGAPCYRGAAADPSFRDWSCGRGLSCEAAGADPDFGMCFVASARRSP